jgi:cellulose synthase/poly-beta-1,6-N-acetylglucosamine synthase-like glycosyltransferase
MSLLLLAGGWIIFGVWVLGITPSLVVTLWRSLDSVAARLQAPGAWPRVSMIVPARDEEKKIESAMRSKLAIDYPNLEVLAINDRSQDATGAILDRIAADDPRLCVLHLDSLPEGWLGKSHAMHVAATRATGDYLLFTDADVFFERDVLRKAVTMCEARGLDHLALMPRLASTGFFEQALELYFAMMLCIASQPWLVRSSLRMSYVGVGAFNMVRRTAYNACGGHVAIRLDVLDDVKLGKLIKHAGFKQDVLDSAGGIQVRWQDSFWGVVRGLEKNGFAVFDYSLRKLILGTLLMAFATLFPYVAVAVWPGMQTLGYLAAIVFFHLSAAFAAVRLGFSMTVSAGLPVAVVTLIYTMWRSAVFTLKRQGVRWRDTFYPLRLLREHVY